MAAELKYMPTFRARQQEIIVLKSFDFGENIWPMIEIIKEKDRTNNTKDSIDIYSSLIKGIHAKRVFIDLPAYIRDVSGMQDEVLSFNRKVLSNLEKRIEFFNSLISEKGKIIPVISTLLLKTGQTGTITIQYNALKRSFPSIAIRTFTNTFMHDLPEIKSLLKKEDYLIYDIDETMMGLTNPVMKRVTKLIETITGVWKIALRSAINTEIQNVKLNHGEIVYQADNSLMELYKTPLNFDAFGDYAGIKKDDLAAGGTISPGFIFYNPVDNLYYGYKGNLKDLAEFETTIVPAVLSSQEVANMKASNPEYLNEQNEGWNILQRINSGEEPGKSQAKFKRISMEHYLHCMRVNIGS